MRHGYKIYYFAAEIVALRQKSDLNIRIGMRGIISVIKPSFHNRRKRELFFDYLGKECVAHLVFYAYKPLASLALHTLRHLFGIIRRRRALAP